MPKVAPAAAPAPTPEGVPDYGTVDLSEGAGPGAAAPAPAASADDAERLITELTRSLLYFRQVSRGSSISKLFWSGEAPSEEAKALIQQRLKLEISEHPSEKVAIWPRKEAGHPSDFAVALGLAKAGQVPGQANLLPAEYQRRRQRRSRIVASAVAWAAFIVVTVGIFGGLQNAQNRYREVVQESEALTSSRSGAQADFVKWTELRKQAEGAYAADRSLRTKFTRWRALLAWLGASTPREMTFTEITVDQGPSGYLGELRGQVRGKDPSEVQERLNGFLGTVSTRSLGQGVLYAPVEVRPMTVDEGKGVVQEFRLTFTLAPES
jgi:hypothetical protein